MYKLTKYIIILSFAYSSFGKIDDSICRNRINLEYNKIKNTIISLSDNKLRNISLQKATNNDICYVTRNQIPFDSLIMALDGPKCPNNKTITMMRGLTISSDSISSTNVSNRAMRYMSCDYSLENVIRYNYHWWVGSYEKLYDIVIMQTKYFHDIAKESYMNLLWSSSGMCQWIILFSLLILIIYAGIKNPNKYQYTHICIKKDGLISKEIFEIRKL